MNTRDYLHNMRDFLRTMKDFTCDVCSRSYQNKNSLGQHQRTQHGIFKTKSNPLFGSGVTKSGREIICPFCLITHGSHEELRRHFNECDYDVEDIEIPTKETLKYLQSPGDKYFCEIEQCQEGVRTLEDLHYHNYISHPTCLKCAVPWPNRREYEKHVKQCKARIEDNDNILKRNEADCPICGRFYYNLWQLKRHLESDHSIRKGKRK